MPKFDYKPGDIIRAAVDYRVIRTLGAGGMGAVYLGEHCELYRRFAVKTLHADLWDRTDLIEMFGNEARTVARLGQPEPHRGIIEVVDLGRTKDRGRMPYMVMPHLIGETLHESLRRQGSLPVLQAIGTVSRLCEALHHAHERGVIHRDVKPENIFIPQVSDGITIQVLDWGISKLLAQADNPSVFIGTPAWASKEQMLGQGIGPLSDVYSAGVVLFRCLTGKMPFAVYGSSFENLLEAVDEPAPPLRAFGDFPRELAAIVASALSKDPSGRPRDALALGEELQAIGRAIRKSRDPHTHVTDRILRPARDPHAVPPEPITEAAIAARTIEDTDIPRRVEAERRRLLEARGSSTLGSGEHRAYSPPTDGPPSAISGFERTVEHPPAQLRAMARAAGPMGAEASTTASPPKTVDLADLARRAMRDAPTNLPGPRSRPIEPPPSIHYVQSPPNRSQARMDRVFVTVPMGPPRGTVPMGRPLAKPIESDTSRPLSLNAAPSLATRVQARYRWLFGSRAWRDLGRPMMLMAVSAMLTVLAVLSFKASRSSVSATEAPLVVSAPTPEPPAPSSATTEAPASAPSAAPSAPAEASAEAPDASAPLEVAKAPAPTAAQARPPRASSPAPKAPKAKAPAPPPAQRVDHGYVDFDGHVIVPSTKSPRSASTATPARPPPPASPPAEDDSITIDLIRTQ